MFKSKSIYSEGNNKVIKINNSFPSDSISKLLNYFQSGQLNFAEELAISL